MPGGDGNDLRVSAGAIAPTERLPDDRHRISERATGPEELQGDEDDDDDGEDPAEYEGDEGHHDRAFDDDAITVDDVGLLEHPRCQRK